tara:strand:- start:56101 stop:56607 length:507 start_codon:yes stop_codon:yes gene_type:complete
MNTFSARHEQKTFDPGTLRNCFGKFATGVTVVSLQLDGKPHGLTVNSFTSVSLDPPLVLVCVDKRSKAVEALKAFPFAINVLSAEQEDMAWHFSGKPRIRDIGWQYDATGVPFLQDTVARILCQPWSIIDAGDHQVVVGQVYGVHSIEIGALAFFAGQFSKIDVEKLQ